VAPAFFWGEMPNLCCALTRDKPGFGECHPAFTPPLRVAALLPRIRGLRQPYTITIWEGMRSMRIRAGSE